MKQSSTPLLPENLCFLFIFIGVVLTGCKQKSSITEETVSDTTSAQSGLMPSDTASDSNEMASNVSDENNPAALWAHEIISYQGTAMDDVRKALENFSPLTPVLNMAERSVAIKDSLEMKRRDASGEYIDRLTDPADSLVFRPIEIKAWQAIQEYKKWFATGTRLNDDCPSLLELTRGVDAVDKSVEYLPEAGTSKYLSHGKFFLFGGAPFIHELIREDGTPFTDAQGNPEKHYSSTLTENGNYFLNSFYHFRNVRANITFGEPLHSYDNGLQEVNGVGSLVHEFLDPIHVFFLTENGVVPARLISTKVKLVPENLGCVSDQPDYIFSCGKNIDANEILAIYVPYHSEPVTEFKLTRLDKGVWTADLNEDGIADLACVPGSFEGIGSDTMAEVLWFVNNNGTWQIIDYASELDCT